jgi:4-amino-4-deoxy-L-arabinose transferase-like glycosyltransferase
MIGEQRRRPTGTERAVLAAAVLAIVVLRLVALRSDPYPLLDWCTGLMGDEGFYMHNARNTILFGHPRTDEFNNMLVSPLLHYTQVAFFSVFGVGSLQARVLSVIAGLLSLPVLFGALRRAFDTRLALTGVLLLGLEHTYLLYNRMALMDTPAALGAVAAFYAFVRARSEESRARRGRWLFACGVLLGLTVISRTLCVYLIPVPLLAIAWSSASSGDKWRRLAWIYGGLLSVVILYGILWYLPHHAEISRMNHFYRTEQVQPGSWDRLQLNLQRGFLGHAFGVLPYQFRHTPVLFLLSLTGVGIWALGIRRRTEDGAAEKNDALLSEAVGYLAAWLACGWSLLILSNYAPSRYYVTLYPPMAALAAILLFRLPELRNILRQRDLRTQILRGALIWFTGYHLLMNAFVLLQPSLTPLMSRLALYGLPSLAVLGDRMLRTRRDSVAIEARRPMAAFSVLVGIWLLFNAGWLAHWLATIRYTQYELSRWLGENLPAGSVLLGDVAPGLSMDNRHMAISVMPGLANDEKPVEAFAGRPRFVAILDGELRPRESYWLANYPQLVAPRQRLKAARVVKFPIGIYPVEALPEDGATSYPSALPREASDALEEEPGSRRGR